MYIYSAKTNMFYPEELRDDYVDAGSWPEDGMEVDDANFAKFTSPPPDGQMRIAGADGLPAWGDKPSPTQEQLVQQTENQKTALLNEASNVTADWRVELSLGIISDEDKASLTAWVQYVKALKAVDTSAAPSIIWPTPPPSL